MEAQLHDRVKEDRIRELPKLIEAEDNPIMVELLARELPGQRRVPANW